MVAEQEPTLLAAGDVAIEHWGVSYTTQLSVPAVALGHLAIDAGADLILGHHAHVLQGVEVYKGSC